MGFEMRRINHDSSAGFCTFGKFNKNGVENAKMAPSDKALYGSVINFVCGAYYEE
jgi:hypothetical protein